MYFSAANPTYGRELFKYDGVSVSLAADIRPGSSSSLPYDLTLYDGQLVFHASGGTAPSRTLFRYDSDGNFSALEVDEVLQLTNAPSDLAVFNNDLYLRAGLGRSGSELVRISVVPEPRGGVLLATVALLLRLKRKEPEEIARG